jgi:hypothetical protein
MVASLCLLLVAFSVVGALLTQAVSSESLENAAWVAVARLLDESSIQESGTFGHRFIGLLLVLVGVVFVSTVIALVVTALQDSLDRVRNGSTELRHVPDLVVLGWSDQLFTLLHEFAMGQPHRSAAVVSSHPRAWMDGQIQKECESIQGRLQIDCRSADRADPRDLAVVRTADAPRVVILGEPEDKDDAAVVKSIFSAVTANAADSPQLMIAEICGQATTRSLEEVFSRRLLTVDTNELLALILAQAVRAQGMGQVLDQLTSYRGCEFYDHDIPAALTGRRFGDLAWLLESASPVGLARDSTVEVLPDASTIVESGDRIIVVDQERRALSWASDSDIRTPASYATPGEPTWSSQRILMVGWNLIVARAVEHLRGFLGEESHITVLADRASMSTAEEESLTHSRDVEAKRLFDSSADLLGAVQGELEADGVDAIAIVPYRENMTPSQSDATSLVTLTSVRGRLDNRDIRVVTELRDTKSAALTELVQPDDLVLSDAVTASTIAQLADRPWLDGVLADLLDYHGSAFFIHPKEAVRDALSGDVACFLDIRRSLMERGELAVGLRIGRSVVLNPVAPESIATSSVSGIVVVGAGIGWGSDNVQSRMADVL